MTPYANKNAVLSALAGVRRGNGYCGLVYLIKVFYHQPKVPNDCFMLEPNPENQTGIELSLF